MKVFKFIYGILSILIIVCMTSCNDDILIENPDDIEFTLLCQDSDGNNLLNDNECLNNISVELGIQILIPRSGIEAGLSSSTTNLVYKESDDGNVSLTLGTFIGTVTQDRIFIINWSDGTSDEVRFVNNVEKKSGGYKVTRNYYLNGEEIPEPIISHTIK